MERNVYAHNTQGLPDAQQSKSFEVQYTFGIASVKLCHYVAFKPLRSDNCRLVFRVGSGAV